ncbi:MAG: type I 3-dehydroquinate dehydratase [Ignisphaera sp.]
MASIPVRYADDVLKVYSCCTDVDFIELRVDYSDDPLSINYSLIKNSKIIVTLRDVQEGGVKKHSDEIKLSLLNKLVELGIMYDVEMRFVKEYGVDYRNKIVSIHILNPYSIDLKSVKKDVESFIDKAFVVKVATKPFPGYRTFLMELLELGDNVAVMPIGSSPIERIAFALLGSKLLYCYIYTPTASGQPKCDEIKQILAEFKRLRLDDEPPPHLSSFDDRRELR